MLIFRDKSFFPFPAYGYRMGGANAADGSLLNGVENATRSAFQSVESVIQAFSSVSMMLESTLFAAQNSIRAIASSQICLYC